MTSTTASASPSAPAMPYRRFGKTGLRMPVLTCGGMRYQQSWKEDSPEPLDAASQANLEATVRRAVAAGINHIETARGYGSSEYQLGRVLPAFPRDTLLVQTKIGPRDSADAFLRTFDHSLRLLQLDYVDLLSVHGINTPELLDQTLHRGTLDACRRLQAEGRARHIGFSTHGPTAVIVAAIETGAFSYVNLHWFYFDRLNEPALAAAQARDMGVFIISPNDKGGKLYAPPAKLTRLCAPLTPMGFNDLFCLAHPAVHTLSIGATRPSDYDAHLAMLPLLAEPEAHLAPIVKRLQDELAQCLGADWAAHWQADLPPVERVPGEVPLYQVLRLYNLAKAYDMVDYAQMRYNLLGSGDHWFPGNKVNKLKWSRLPDCLSGYPFADRLPAILREAHDWFNATDKRRLSQSE